MYNGLQQEQSISEVVSQVAARPLSTATDANVGRHMRCSGTTAHAADIISSKDRIILSTCIDLAKHSHQGAYFRVQLISNLNAASWFHSRHRIQQRLVG
jgi:hypothetical protein